MTPVLLWVWLVIASLTVYGVAMIISGERARRRIVESERLQWMMEEHDDA